MIDLRKPGLPLITLVSVLLFAGCNSTESPVGENGNSNGTSVVIPEMASDHPFIIVAGMSTLTFFDPLASVALEGRLGAGNAANWIIADGNRLLVINSLSNDLVVYRKWGNVISLDKVVDLGVARNNNPFCGTLTAGGKLLVTNMMQNTVSVLDADSFAEIAIWETGISPEGILIDDNFAYVICSGYSFDDYTFHPGSIAVHSLEDGAIVEQLSTGINAQFAARDSLGRLHIVCTGDYGETTGEVRVYETSPLRETARIPLEGYPGRISLAPWGTAYLAAGGWIGDGGESGLVLTYDWRTFQVGVPISVSAGVTDVVIDSIQGAVFAACFDAVSLDEIRADTLFAAYPLDDPPQALGLWMITN